MLENLITSTPMFVCVFWCLLLLWDVIEKRQTAKKRLLLYMVAAALLYMGHYVFFNHKISVLPLSDTVYCITNLAVFPLYYIYLKELTEPVWNHRWQWLLLVPTIVIGFVVGMLYMLMSPAEKAQFIEDYLYHNQLNTLSGLCWWQAFAHHVAKAVFALQIPPILLMGFRKINAYNHALETFYADTDDKRLRMVKSMLVLFVVTSFLAFGANLTGRYSFADSWLLLLPAIMFSVLQFMLGYAGYHQQFSIRDLLREMEISALEPVVSTVPTAEEEVEVHNVINELPQQITDVVSRERLYLRPNLKITEVADLLHTNRTYVSRALKEKMGTTFSDFINSQRIAYACQLMKQQPQLSAKNVAKQSGFSSLSSFYRNYKLHTGRTPNQLSASQPAAV